MLILFTELEMLIKLIPDPISLLPPDLLYVDYVFFG